MCFHDRNLAHAAARNKLAARYMGWARAEVRRIRAEDACRPAGTQPRLSAGRYADEAIARNLAELRAGEALRLGVADDLPFPGRLSTSRHPVEAGSPPTAALADRGVGASAAISGEAA